ncbi:tetratricopeptide repeat protein [Pannus brasiliensis CCIBt3594]|uniref:Tetratricopeptide repeat protein n=1 Tax=Pannus brasiliensis CCIBt3594 TaxID=1427578 RepID=A0AAW9QIF8_9CHRO
MPPLFDRLQLRKTLIELIPADFNALVYALKVPLKYLPPTQAESAIRVDQFLNWANSPTGCGLERVREELLKLIRDSRQPDETEILSGWYFAHSYASSGKFTGRMEERQTLTDWLENDPKHPLFILSALGGFGKSALTWEWVNEEVKTREGVWQKVLWWSFYEESANFTNFIRVALAYLSGCQPGNRSPRQQVEDVLALLTRIPALIVMDGFERELRAYGSMNAAYQGDEVGDSPSSALQAEARDCIHPLAEYFLRELSSRRDLRGKVLMSTRLCPRAVEDRHDNLPLAGCRTLELAGMSAGDAVAFFESQGIRGTRDEFARVADTYGGHPLSLQLLSGRIRRDLRNPDDIRVAFSLDVTSDLRQRQHHVLEIAYNFLSPACQALLSRIACFRSPVELEVLEAISEGDSELQANLYELIDRGLLNHDKKNRRFDLHPIVRRYAYDRLIDVDRTTEHERMRDYFAAVPPPEKVTTLEDLVPVIELYHHTVRSGRYDEAFELFRDRISEATYYQLGAYQLQIELLRALFPHGEDRSPELKNEITRSWTLNALANSYSLNGQPAKAIPLYERQIAIRKKADDKKNLAIGLGNLAYQQLTLGSLQSAEANLRRRIALCQAIENEFNEAIGHQELGRLLAYRGVWAEAERELDTALELFEKNNHIQWQGIVWSYRALIALLKFRQGDTSARQTALSAAGRSLELVDENARTNYPIERDYIRSHWLLGASHRVNGNLDQSEHHLNESLTRCRTINMVDHEADILLDLARLRAEQGQTDEALRLAEEAMIISDRSRYVLQGADIRLFLAERARERGELTEARDLVREALRLATCDGGDYCYRVAYDEATRLLRELS